MILIFELHMIISSSSSVKSLIEIIINAQVQVMSPKTVTYKSKVNEFRTRSIFFI